MKKSLFIICICFILIVMIVGCSKKNQPAAEINKPVITEEPSPTAEIINITTPSPTETPKPKKEGSSLKNILISDADVDSVLNDDVDKWEGFSVETLEGEGETVFYIYPLEEHSESDIAIGSVIMTYNDVTVEKVACNVFTDQDKNNHEACQQLFNYFKNQFPMAVIAELEEEDWLSAIEELEISYDKALESVSDREIDETVEQTEPEGVSVSKGQFTYTVNTNVVSFVFNME